MASTINIPSAATARWGPAGQAIVMEGQVKNVHVVFAGIMLWYDENMVTSVGQSFKVIQMASILFYIWSMEL